MKKNLFLITIWSLIITCSDAQSRRYIEDVLPTRQVHLDFHTSEFIPGIGKKFSAAQWQSALRLGHVNSINIFAKCHQGWSYYPTNIGNMHPNLNFDLLGAQIEASHQIGVKCPIYFTVGWSANDAETHPSWCARNKDGAYMTASFDLKAQPDDVKPNTSWKMLCPAFGGPYHELIKNQVKEICSKYPVDGFWFDIYFYTRFGCYCNNCKMRMAAERVDMNDEKAVIESTTLAYKKHMEALRQTISIYYPMATVFFNNTVRVGNNPNFINKTYEMNTHQELEDLPTTWGGYDKLPLEAKFYLSKKYPVVAMSGKFHTSWGEFGGFKHPDAIKYEAAAMIANGVSCNFGDQLHPSGEMDMATYTNIGEAYKYVEKIEAYGPGGIPVSKTGLWLTLDNDCDLGVVNMLLEAHHDFVIADQDNLAQLDLIILPGKQCLDDLQAASINNWVKKGGKLIIIGDGALDKSKNKFILDIGANYIGKSNFQFDYTVVNSAIDSSIVKSPMLNYLPALLIAPTSATTLATIREPYFNRTYKTYSGHRETPYQLEDSKYPAIIRNNNVIYFANPIDKMYNKYALRLHRSLFINAIGLLHTNPYLKVNNLPSSGRVSFLKQENKNRYVAHLLYSPALQRGEVKVIEDFLPVPGVELEIDVPERIKKVYQVPDGKKLKIHRNGDKIFVKVPTFTMHTAIVLEY